MLQPTKTDKSKVLYDAVSEDYDLGTYEDFSSKLQNPVKRKAFYDGVGSEYNLGSFEEFEAKITTPLKKKDTSEVSSPKQELDLDPKTEVGLLDGVESKNEPTLQDTYKKNIGLTPEQEQEVEAEFEDQKNPSLWDRFRGSQASRLLGLPPKEFEPGKKTKEDITKEKIARNKEEFFETLSKEELNTLAKEEYKKIEKLDTKNKILISDNDFLAKEASDLLKEYKDLKASRKFSKERIELGLEEEGAIQGEINQFTRELEIKNRINAIIQEQKNNINAFEKNENDLQDFSTELSLFKKNWNVWDNTKETIGLLGGKTLVGLAKLRNDFKGAYNPFIPKEVTKITDDALNEVTDVIEHQEQYLRPKVSVENIETMEDFGEFFLETVAEQAITTTAALSGGGGIALLGGSSFGQKKIELERENIKIELENKKGISKLSNTQILTASLFSAGFDTAGALVDKFALTKGARALKAGIKGGGRKSIESGFSKYLKPVIAEIGEEEGALIGGQAVDYYLLDKKKVKFGEGFLNVLAKTGLSVGLMNTIPTLVGDAVGTYHTTAKKGKIKGNLEQVIALQKELNNNVELTDLEKTAITSKIDKIVGENKQILDDTVGLINKLTPEQREQVSKLDASIIEQKKSIQEISKSESLAPESKEVLIKQFENDINENEVSKEEILNPKPTKDESKVNLPNTASKNQETRLEGEVSSPKNTNNETTQERNSIVNEDLSTRDKQNTSEGESNELQTSNELGNSSKETKVDKPIVKKVTSLKGATYDVEFNTEGKVAKIISPKDGREIPKFVEAVNKKTGKKQVKKNANYTKIEADATGVKTENQIKVENKKKINESLDSYTPTNEYEYALHALAKGENVNSVSAKKETGLSAKEIKWASGFNKDADLPSVEKLAEKIVESSDQDLDVQEVRNSLIDIISSSKSKLELQEKIVEFTTLESESKQEQELNLYKSTLSSRDLAKFEAGKAEDDYISELSDQEAIEYLEQQYGRQETENDERGTIESTSVQERTGEEISKKETLRKQGEERKEIAFDKIDNLFDKLKDALPGIDDKDINANGFTQDQLLDLMAKSIKHLVSTGIDIDVAVKQVIASIKDKLNVSISPEELESRISPDKTPTKPEPKKEANRTKKEPSTPESGKKSLLNRAHKGGNSTKITDAIEKHGLDYRIENQEKAKVKAKSFVKEVGTYEALEAVRSNKIKGAEKAFVYQNIIDNLVTEIDNETDFNKKEQLQEEHATIISDLVNEFSQESTDAGRFISALNNVYNSSALKYNLSYQIDQHKATNGGVISDEVLEKFKKADQRIKELESLIGETQERLKLAQEALSIDNIKEDIARKNKRKERDIKRASKELAKKVRSVKIHKPGIFSSASPASLVWDGAIEIVATSIESGGKVADAIAKGLAYIKKSDWYNSLSKKDRNEAESTFKRSINTSTDTPTVTIGENGKISMPTQLIRDYVEAGETDINVIATKIKEDLKEEYPDVTVREIRDAISGYGKQINPTKDEINTKISELRSLGKLLSAYEDALNGKRPLRSGLKRNKPTQEMRDLRAKTNALVKELDASDVDLEREWASALDKIKSQLKNQIQDLDTQISNKEKRKVERTPIKLDKEAENLKKIRDEKKKIIDTIVGKPELSPEQKIARAEKAMQTSIDKLQNEISENRIGYKTKSKPLHSDKLVNLRRQRKALIDLKNQMREESGLIEEKRLKDTKQRVKKQIEDLKTKIKNKDFSKKEPKPLKEDTELQKLKAEKLQQQEIYDAQKYQDELRNRSNKRKALDALTELWNIERIIRATGELSTVLIQGGVLTVSRKFTKPKEFIKIMGKLAKALASSKYAKNQEALIKAHPLFSTAKKSKLALTEVGFKDNVREENFIGDYATFIWDLPFILAGMTKVGKKINATKTAVLGDAILNSVIWKMDLSKKDKISIRDQWNNLNPFSVLERGSTFYMNTLRLEEFQRGVDMLKMEGKNEIDHIKDYKLVANAINSMSGRANLPTDAASSSKMLAVIFFSAKNALSVMNQMNPLYYAYLHSAGTDGIQATKTTAANKIMVTNMMRFVTITGSMMMAIKFAAGENEDGEDAITIETDANSSDFMKLKMGAIRFDPWHGMSTFAVLISRLLTEKVKNSTTLETKELSKKVFGPQSRLDLIASFGRNKLSPSAARLFNYLSTNEKVDPETGEVYRENRFGSYQEQSAITKIQPMYWEAFNEIQKEDPSLTAQFLTLISFFGWNTGVYGTKEEEKKAVQKKMDKRTKPSKRKSAKKKIEAIKKRIEKEKKLREDALKYGIPYVPPRSR